MPSAKLIKSRSLRTLGYTFTKGVHVPVTYAHAKELESDPRFEVRIEKDATQAVTEDIDTSGRPSNKSDRLAAIQNAIGELDDSDGNYTTNGKPDARALTAILGWQVTSAERDEAMANEVETGVSLGRETIPDRSRRGGPILQPGESSETPTPGKDTGDLSEAEIKNPKKTTSNASPPTGPKIAPEKTEPNIAGPKPEDSDAPSETGEEQPSDADTIKKVGGVTLKKKQAEDDPSTEGAKEV